MIQQDIAHEIQLSIYLTYTKKEVNCQSIFELHAIAKRDPNIGVIYLGQMSFCGRF